MEFPKFTSNYKSLMAKHLTPEIFEQLKGISTDNGFSLQDAINSGIVNLDSNIGIYAGDLASYKRFSSLFDPIIREYHGVEFKQQHRTDFNVLNENIGNPDPENAYVLSTRIRVGRNLADNPLGPGISTQQRRQVEAQITTALSQLSGELSGHYYSLNGMKESIKKRLIADHFLFKEGDKYLEAAGLNRDWPDGRGIYHNDQKNFLVWVNEEDQLRIISMQKGGDIEQVLNRLYSALSELQHHLQFMFTDKLGYISSCPTNLGTAMRASVHIYLPNLANNDEDFNALINRYHLQVRGIDGEHTQSKGAVFDISNCRRLGITEIECVEDLFHGVVALIAKEKELERLL